MFPLWHDDEDDVKIENIVKAMYGKFGKWEWDESHWPAKGVLVNRSKVIKREVVKREAELQIEGDLKRAKREAGDDGSWGQTDELRDEMEQGFSTLMKEMKVGFIGLGVKVDYIKGRVDRLAADLEVVKRKVNGGDGGNDGLGDGGVLLRDIKDSKKRKISEMKEKNEPRKKQSENKGDKGKGKKQKEGNRENKEEETKETGNGEEIQGKEEKEENKEETEKEKDRDEDGDEDEAEDEKKDGGEAEAEVEKKDGGEAEAEVEKKDGDEEEDEDADVKTDADEKEDGEKKQEEKRSGDEEEVERKSDKEQKVDVKKQKEDAKKKKEDAKKLREGLKNLKEVYVKKGRGAGKKTAVSTQPSEQQAPVAEEGVSLHHSNLEIDEKNKKKSEVENVKRKTSARIVNLKRGK